MIYLSIPMMVVGLLGIIFGACGYYDAANVAAWIAGLLLIIFWTIIKVGENQDPSTYCGDTCPACGGRGTKVEFTVGLGPHGNVPAYTEVNCPKCGGKGWI